MFGANEWAGSNTATAVFLELGIPVLENLQVNLAFRYEDFDELNVSTSDPKITVLFQPTDSVSLRASAGSSFRTPSLQQAFGFLTTVANQVDVVGGTAFKPSLTVGNEKLKPETADSWNLGLSWIPQSGIFEGLSVDVDYFDYQYDDIITRESSSTLIAEDNAALTAYVAATPGATLIDAAVNAPGRNFRQVIRNSQGIMVRLLPDFANANGANISGIDLNASYGFDTGFGSWKVGTQVAYVNEYDVDVVNSSGGVTTFDAVGSYNSSNPVARPLPEILANATLSWTMDQHRAFLIVKYVDDLTTDVPAGTRGFFAATARLAGNTRVASDLGDTKIESMTTADIQYTYNFGEIGGVISDSSISVGVQNFLDEEAPAIAVVTGFDGTLHDGRGRIFFVRFGASL